MTLLDRKSVMIRFPRYWEFDILYIYSKSRLAVNTGMYALRGYPSVRATEVRVLTWGNK